MIVAEVGARRSRMLVVSLPHRDNVGAQPDVMRTLLVLSLMSAPAHAESAPDPVATRAGEEANLASTEHRQGFTFSLGLGPSITIGGGTGTGGALALRLGQVIRPNAIALVEVTGNGQGHRVMETLHINAYTTLMGGLQVWVGPFAYFRVSAGFGSYRCEQCKDPEDDGNIVPVDYQRRGLTGAAAFGLEPLRFGSVTVGPEAGGILTITPDGVILAISASLVMSVD